MDTDRINLKPRNVNPPTTKLTPTSAYITVHKLAEALGISRDIILTLAELGYIRTYCPPGGRIPEIRKVLCDPTGLIHWPYIALSRVCRRLRRLHYHPSIGELVKLCQDRHIAIHRDESLGYVIHVDELRELFHILQYTRHRRPVDRVWMMLWLAGLDSLDPNDMPPFYVFAEKELMRIAKLKEPMRTEQALRFALRYRDAETVAKAILNARVDDVLNVAKKRDAERLRSRSRTLAALELPESTARAKKNAAGMRRKDAKRQAQIPQIPLQTPPPTPSFAQSPRDGTAGSFQAPR